MEKKTLMDSILAAKDATERYGHALLKDMAEKTPLPNVGKEVVNDIKKYCLSNVGSNPNENMCDFVSEYRNMLKEVESAIDLTFSDNIDDVKSGIKKLRELQNSRLIPLFKDGVNFFLATALQQIFEKENDKDAGEQALNIFESLHNTGAFSFVQKNIKDIQSKLLSI